MNEKTAKTVAGLVGGQAVNSGGNVFIIEVQNPGLTTLCLGNGGWWIEDKDGIHVMDGEGLD
jgi:hypothetical protein